MRVFSRPARRRASCWRRNCWARCASGSRSRPRRSATCGWSGPACASCSAPAAGRRWGRSTRCGASPACGRSWRAPRCALRRDPPDLVVLVDFGAFNLRLARSLRLLGLRQADRVLRAAGGLAGQPAPRARRRRAVRRADDLPPPGRLLPLAGAADRLPRAPAGVDRRAAPGAPGAARPAAATSRCCRAAAGARSSATRRACSTRWRGCARCARTCARRSSPPTTTRSAHIEHLLSLRSPLPIAIARDARAALRDADAAAIASGTAVLEAALIETPALALYVLSERAGEDRAPRLPRHATSRCPTWCSTSRWCPS